MRSTLEARWVSFLDSRSWRRVTNTAPAQRMLRGATFRRINHARRHAITTRRADADMASFDSVHTFCLMVGHTKSGGTMLGSLLDAHPQMVFADELDVLDHVSAGFDRSQLSLMIERAARREALKGRVTARRLEPYSFAVPGQHQGSSDHPLVLGESRAGIATQRLGRDPGLLDRLASVVEPAAVKLVHVVRNPYDPIALMTIRGKRSFDEAADRYFANCVILDRLHQTVPAGMILTVPYETFVAMPAQQLRALATHLGVDADEAWVDACASIIRDRPERERTMVDWDPAVVRSIAERIEQHRFLGGYTFDEPGAS